MFSDHSRIKLGSYLGNLKLSGSWETYFLRKLQVKEKPQKKILNILNGKKIKTQHQNLWDGAKIVIKRKPVALNIYIRKEGMKINNLSYFHLKKLDKGKQSESN